MSVLPHRLTPGAKLYDTQQTSLPAHRRLYRLASAPNKKGMIDLVHIASGARRTIAADVEGLKLVPDLPDLAANLDCLVGERIQLNLKDGYKVTGFCTGVLYHFVEVLGVGGARQILSIELDRSGSTTYPWHEIEAINSI